MALAKIAFKLGGSRLSAAQKRALAKAIRASALRRSKRASKRIVKFGLKRKKIANRSVILTKKLSAARALKSQRAVRSSKLLLARASAENKYKNPSFISSSLGLNNPQKALKQFKKADKAYVKAMVFTNRSEKQVAALQNKLLKSQGLDTKLINKITKNQNTAAMQIVQANRYAKIAGVAATAKAGNEVFKIAKTIYDIVE